MRNIDFNQRAGEGAIHINMLCTHCEINIFLITKYVQQPVRIYVQQMSIFWFLTVLKDFHSTFVRLLTRTEKYVQIVFWSEKISTQSIVIK